jgi:hypothetical protein
MILQQGRVYTRSGHKCNQASLLPSSRIANKKAVALPRTFYVHGPASLRYTCTGHERHFHMLCSTHAFLKR